MAEDADRTAFIQAAIRELQLQRERGGLSTPLHRSDRDAFDALGFDMPVVRPEDAWELSRTLAAAAAAAVSGGRSAASLPPWFKVTKRFVSGVVYCAERHVGQLPVSAAAATAVTAATEAAPATPAQSMARLYATVFIKLLRMQLAAHAAAAGDAALAETVTWMVQAPVSFDHMSALPESEWHALHLDSDLDAIVQHLLCAPVALSAFWSKFLRVIRDRAIARPAVAVAGVASILRFHNSLAELGASALGGSCAAGSPAAASALSSSELAVVSRFVNAVVVSAACDVCEQQAAASQSAFRAAAISAFERVLVCSCHCRRCNCSSCGCRRCRRRRRRRVCVAVWLSWLVSVDMARLRNRRTRCIF
jgi:hypothetical protein